MININVLSEALKLPILGVITLRSIKYLFDTMILYNKAIWAFSYVLVKLYIFSWPPFMFDQYPTFGLNHAQSLKFQRLCEV